MVDLMMWLVIAALLLAAAIQGIGYYQKAAYLYQIQSDLEGVGTIATGIAANEDGVVTKAVVDKALLEAKRSTDIVTTVELASDGKTPFIRGVHPSVSDKDGLYLFDACSDLYKIGVNVVPKNGTVELEECGISAAPPGSGSGSTTPPAGGTPTPDDLDGDTIPNASDPDIDGDGTPNGSDTTPNGETPAGGGSGTTPPVNTVGAIGRTSTLQIAGFGAQWTDDLADGTGNTLAPSDFVLQGPLAAEQIYMFSTNVSAYHQCAVGTLERDLYCWGEGGSGQIGDGTVDDKALPTKVAALSGKSITEVGVGGDATCAVANNVLYCWGDGWLTDTADNLTPVEVGTSVFAGRTLTNLAVGNSFACVAADGTPYCWGTNSSGQLGNGDGGQHPDGATKRSGTPVAVVTTAFGGQPVTEIGVSGKSACLVAGEVYCWGRNTEGHLGNGTSGYTPDWKDLYSDVPVAVIGEVVGKNVTAIYGGYSNMCAIAAGTLYCWGSDYTDSSAAVFQNELSGKTVTAYGNGDGHACVVASEKVYCWGDGESIGAPSYMDGEWESWDWYDNPVLIDNGAIAGKKVQGLWSTAAGNFVNYIK